MTIERGCTQSEALNAAKKIQSLLSLYNLTEECLDEGSAFEFDKKYVVTNRKRKPIVSACLLAITEYCDCFFWTEKDPDGTIKYVLFGDKNDLEIASYLYDLFNQFIQQEQKNYKVKQSIFFSEKMRRAMKKSYLYGICDGLSKQLTLMKEERLQQFYKENTKSVALVDLRKERLKQAFDDQTKGFKRKSSPQVKVLKNYFHQGVQKGIKLHIKKAIGQ